MKLKTLILLGLFGSALAYGQDKGDAALRLTVTAELGRPAHVGSGSLLVTGLTVTGTRSTRVLVKAKGPSLTSLGIVGALQDPTLEIRDRNGTIASNDDWKDTQEGEIIATRMAPIDDRESAIVISLEAGFYTVVVRGKNGGGGAAMVEAYFLE